MDQSELYDRWQAEAGRDRRNKDRPAFVLEHADALREHTSTDDDPPTEGIGDARAWLARYKATVTRQLADGDAGEVEA